MVSCFWTELPFPPKCFIRTNSKLLALFFFFFFPWFPSLQSPALWPLKSASRTHSKGPHPRRFLAKGEPAISRLCRWNRRCAANAKGHRLALTCSIQQRLSNLQTALLMLAIHSISIIYYYCNKAHLRPGSPFPENKGPIEGLRDRHLCFYDSDIFTTLITSTYRW